MDLPRVRSSRGVHLLQTWKLDCVEALDLLPHLDHLDSDGTIEDCYHSIFYVPLIYKNLLHSALQLETLRS